MATAPLPRSEVYLSLLAAKALTALADLAANPAAWNASIQTGLESGVEYCEACPPSVLSKPEESTGSESHAFRRQAISSGSSQGTSKFNTSSECERVKGLLRKLLLRQRRPVMADLDTAINFFSTDGC
jgi:hypothetical protein